MTARDRLPFRIGARWQMPVRWFTLMLSLAFLCAGAEAFAQTPPPPSSTTSSSQSQALPPGVTNPAEYKNYLAAVNTQDAAKRAQALEIFLAWYPYSVLRTEAYEQTMAAWQAANNPAKADAIAVRLLQLDPDNVRALANRAYSGRTQAMAGDEKALAPAVEAARRGIAALPKWRKPAPITEPDFTRLKMQIVAVFDGTLGYAALQAKDYAKARTHFLEAVNVDPTNLPDTYQLAVSLLEAKPIDALGFWYAARAIAIARSAKNETAAAEIEKYARARYIHYHGSDKDWSKLVTRVAGEQRPPDNFAESISRAMSPAETAVYMAEKSDVGSLSFDDWEFILSHRGDSPDNQAAADKVWKAIMEKQQGGARLKLPVKVIKAASERIEAALSEESQARNTVDLEITLGHPLRPLPAVGSTISIIGVLSDYRPAPFRFFLTNAELAEESMPVAGGACADPRPQMCTRDYRPACGVRRDGSRQTYGNACTACADSEVVSQAAGACP
jgi:tetratricopeptide (TPR) repeat protein